MPPLYTPPPQTAFHNAAQIAQFLACHIYTLSGEYERALPFCEKLLKSSPNGITVRDLLEVAYATKNIRLLEEMEKFLSSPKGGTVENRKVLLSEVKALIAYLEGDKGQFKRYTLEVFREGEAPHFLLEAAAKEANPFRDWELTAWLLFYLHERQPDREELKEALKTLLLGAPAWGRGEKAKELLERFIELDPRPEYYRWLGQLLILSKDYDRAVEVLREGYKRYPNDRELKRMLLYAYFVTGRVDESFTLFSSANGTLYTPQEKASLLALLNSPEGRELLVENLAQLFTENPSPLERILYASYLIGWDKAVLVFGGALERILKNPTAEDLPFLSLYWLTRLKSGQPLNGAQEKLVNDLLEEYKNNSFLLLVKAYDETLKGKTEEALETLKGIDVKKLTPPFLPPYLALLFYHNYNWDDRYLKLLSPRGVSQTLQYLYPLSPFWADKLAERYIEINKSPSSFAAVIDSFFRLGDLQRAAKYAELAVQSFPDNPDFLNTYAYTLLLLKGKDAAPKAVKLIKRALEKRPNSGAYLDSLGWAYYLLGELKRAQTYLSEALKKNPEDPVVNYHYGALLFREGKYCTAEGYLKRALSGIYSSIVEPEPGILKKLKKLLKEVNKRCQTP